MSNICKDKPAGLVRKYTSNGVMLCGVLGCNKHGKVKGMCLIHWHGYEETGIVGKERDKRFKSAQPKCLRCERKAKENGLCNRHHMVSYRQSQRNKKEVLISLSVGKCSCSGMLLPYGNNAYCIECAIEYAGPKFSEVLDW